MTRYFAQHPDLGAICPKCNHDLFVKVIDRITNGKVFCSNQRCYHFNNNVPTGQHIHTGRRKPSNPS